MSTVAEEDERRKRSLEAGKDLLEKYKIARSKAQGMHYSHTDEQSDEESYHNDKSMDQRGSFMNEVMSSRDITQSSVSMSEGEADRDLEGMAGRVAELEELLQGKEAIVAALNAEIDHLRGETSSPNSSQSHNSSIPSRDVICLYHTKLQEFEKAINQRDNLIEDLTSSLEQALSARDALVAQLNSLNATRESSPKGVHGMNLQEKIETLESTLTNQKLIINKLNSQLAQIHKHVQTLEMEKETRNAEISDYKMQINNLNEQIRLGAAEKNLNIAEMLEQQKQYEARVDKIKQDMQHILEKFTAETNTNTARHQQELKELGTKHETEMKNMCMKYEEHLQSLKEENKSLADRLNKELPDLESRHAKELSVFQVQLAHYKKTVETLKLELVNRSEAQNRAQAESNMYKKKFEEFQVQAENACRMQELNNQKEKELLNEQIELHKIQLDEITSKYVAATTVLESKESIERSLEQALVNAATLKQENDGLKFKLDDLSSRYSAAQSLIENNQAHERTMSSKIYDLEKSLSRLSGINASMFSEFNETTYQTLDEVTIKYQLTKQKLEEKEELEKILIDKIQELEGNACKMKEELEQATLTNRSYEKQLKDTKNMCDKLESEIISLRESTSKNSASSVTINNSSKTIDASEKNELIEMLKRITFYENEIEDLKQVLKQKNAEIAEYTEKLNDLAEKMKKSEDESQQLKNGLAAAWFQCAEAEEKLNQTLAINDSTIDASLPLSEYCAALPKHFGPNKTYNDFTNDSLNTFIDNSKTDIKLDNAMNNDKIESLQNEIASVTKENENLFKEMEHLLEKQTNYDEISNKLHHYSMLCEKLESEKQSLLDENRKLKTDWEEINVLRKSIDDLQIERKKLKNEIESLIEKHKYEINAIKVDCSAEIKAMQTLLLNVKEGNIELNELKAELETRHAKEMEELRTYFEQKCLQMEKQYSEEIFSQQSKKMSDNDSEIEELTEDLYFGGAGDCLNVGNASGHHSRSGTPIGSKETKQKISSDNVSHIELEQEASMKMLQQQLDKKSVEVDNLKLYYEKLLEDLKETYEKQLKYTKENTGHLLLTKSINQCCQTEFDTRTLENGELSKLQAAYNLQLEEQVALARLDIVNALQEQIQALLLVETDGDDNWPPELLVLRDKLTNNAKQQIQELKEKHAAEVFCLREEYSQNLIQLAANHKEEINKIKSGDMKIETSERKLSVDNSVFSTKTGIKERDHLQKVCLTLKNLIGELIKYFAVCEEEVNNTLLNEVLKRKIFSSEVEKDISAVEIESSKKIETNLLDTSLNSSEMKIKRVHFAPQFDEITSIINSDNDALRSIIVHNEDILDRLRSELNNNLHRLRLESAEIFKIPFSSEEKIDMPLKNAWKRNIVEELTIKLNHTESLLLSYQEESEQLKMNILELQRKLINAESKKEIITEGYGEHDETRSVITLQDFSQLQEKARHVLSNGGGEGSYLLQLIEELCTQSDKLMEDAKREKEDLQQQVPLEPTSPTYIHKVYCEKIEAADKQLRATRTFLEEQAAERESERDEAARQINYLQEQIKEREREKDRDQRMTSENSLSPDPSTEIPVLPVINIAKTVEALETQMKEMTSLMSDTEARKCETESELKAAVDKIWVLRDIVADLEQQLQSKLEREESLQLQITQLEAIITAQTKNQQDLVQELDSIKMGETSRQMNERITHLQEELRKHKLSSEHFDANSSALKQMKVELRDLQLQLDKRIKNLESLHISDSTSSFSQSQPSEDVSIREQIDAARCPTPDDPTSPPTLPLDQILKLKDKILKHARVEEAACKKIKDLEMELSTLKNQNEELQAEQEILQQTASEQLYQMEAMRGRLEQQKQSAPFAQRQATSRLELELHEANTKIQLLEQTISDKELELNDLKDQLQRSNQLLLEKEAEIANVVQLESMTIQKLKDRLTVVEEEKKNLQSKVGIQEQAQLELPQLIDSMLADKNEEIDHLKEQLFKKEKQLEIYSSIALDESQLRELVKHVEPKNSARTLSDILSIHSECEDVSEALRCDPSLVRTIPHNISSFRVSSNSPSSKDPIDASMILLTDMNKISMQVPPLDLGSHSQSACHRNKQTIVEIDLPYNKSELKIYSSDNNVEITKQFMESKESIESHVEKELSQTDVPHADNKKVNIDNSQDSSKSYHISVSHSGELDNETIQIQVQQLEKELSEIKEQLNMKSTMLDKRESELLTLRKEFDELQLELKETCETQTRDKYFYKNQYELLQASENKIRKDLMQVENTLKLKSDELQDMKDKMSMNEKIIIELNSENSRLKETVRSREEEAIEKYIALVKEKTQELQNLQENLTEKEITIETIRTRNIEIEDENKQLYEYKKQCDIFEQELMERHSEIQRLTDGLNNRDQIIRRLEKMARRSSLSGASSPSDCKDQEIHHLQEYLKEKDKVIRQMSDDSKSLHRALETIQNKMKESGNVVELRKKLKEEHKINAELRSMVEKLTKDLEHLKEYSARRSQDDTDIEDMVQRELNLSARLDKQIMSAIDSDSEDFALKGMERESTSRCSSPYKKKTDEDQWEVLVRKCAELKLRLKHADKVNEELLKLKDELEIEKEMLKCQVSEYENRIFQIKADLTQESKKVTELDKELTNERHTVRTLKLQVEKNQKAMQSAQMQDNELIEFLQAKLKSSLEMKEKLPNKMSSMRQEQEDLEVQLNSMREHVESEKSDKSSGLVDLLQIERKKYIKLLEEYEKEQRNNAELKDSVKKIEMEKNRYEKHLEVVMEEKESLVSSLVLVEGIKEQLETDLRRTKEELKAKEDECEWLQKRIKMMSDAEAKRQDQRSSEHYELKSLRRELDNAREVIVDLEADMKQSKQELKESMERESKLRQKLESLKGREVELIEKLNVSRDEERKQRELAYELQQKLKTCVKKVLDLTKEVESRFTKENNDPAKYMHKIKELTDMNEKHAGEKDVLYFKLTKVRQDKEQLKQQIKELQAQLQQNKYSPSVHATGQLDNVDKAQHIYGKYLRANSKRKSLIYQKRYLLCVIGSYEISEENTFAVLAQLTHKERLYARKDHRKKGKLRFKSAVIVIVSIHRMKWMILRWRLARRVGANTLLGNGNPSFVPPLRFISQNHSPPVREKSIHENDAASVTGFALEQYCQRLKNIQQTLGLAMVEPGTVDDMSSE